jgi:hypothetical protein
MAMVPSVVRESPRAKGVPFVTRTFEDTHLQRGAESVRAKNAVFLRLKPLY